MKTFLLWLLGTAFVFAISNLCIFIFCWSFDLNFSIKYAVGITTIIVTLDLLNGISKRGSTDNEQ